MSPRLLLLACGLALAACGPEGARRDRPPAAPDSPPSNASVADTGCQQLRGPRADTGIRPGDPAGERWQRDFARGAEYRCVIHATLPAMRLVVVGDTASPTLDSLLLFFDSAGATPSQVLPLDVDMELPSPRNWGALRALDLDADGYRDLMFGKFWGATGNTFYMVWRFDAAARRFVRDTALTDASNVDPVPGRPCVRTSSNTSARDDESALLCQAGGRWRVDSGESNQWDRRTNTVVHEVYARRGDSLVVVRRQVRPDSLE